ADRSSARSVPARVELGELRIHRRRSDRGSGCLSHEGFARTLGGRNDHSDVASRGLGGTRLALARGPRATGHGANLLDGNANMVVGPRGSPRPLRGLQIFAGIAGITGFSVLT